eukprot:206650_1
MWALPCNELPSRVTPLNLQQYNESIEETFPQQTIQFPPQPTVSHDEVANQSTPGFNINPDHAQQCIHTPKETPRDLVTPRSPPLMNQLPTFSRLDPNCIVWYQYLVDGHHTTYSAEWSWDIEGQWLKFQKYHQQSIFSIEHNNHLMICDLLNMKLTDPLTGDKHTLKRTDKLIGTIVSFGQIAFTRCHASKQTEIFLYDRHTGYDKDVCEDDCKIGDRVVFCSWWNMDENDHYYFDITPHIAVDGAHLNMFAFNVKPLLPPITERRRRELAERVETKINQMMMVTEVMLDPRWPLVLKMASSSLYHSQQSAWMLMKHIEPIINQSVVKKKPKKGGQHPKTRVLEWTMKNTMAPPKIVFSEFTHASSDMRIWSGRLSFCGATFECKGRTKKHAAYKCYSQLCSHANLY